MSNNSTRANSPVITSTVVKPTKKTTGSAESDSNDTTTNPAKDTTNENATDDKNVAATKQSAATAKKTTETESVTGQKRVAVIGGNRIPFARSNGPYADASNTDMLTAALDGLIERYNLQGEVLGEVVSARLSNSAVTLT